MAGYNEIQVGRYNRSLQKLLSLKGPASMNELSTTLQAVLAVFHSSENRYLEGWDLFGLTDSIAAVAAQQTFYYLRNPAGSNVVAVVTDIFVLLSVAADSVNYRHRAGNDAPTAGSAGVSAQVIDPRSQRISSSLLNTGGTSAAPSLIGQPLRVISLPTAGDGRALLLNTPEDEIVLAPGTTIELVTGGQNDTMRVNFRWRERFLEDSERA